MKRIMKYYYNIKKSKQCQMKAILRKHINTNTNTE